MFSFYFFGPLSLLFHFQSLNLFKHSVSFFWFHNVWPYFPAPARTSKKHATHRGDRFFDEIAAAPEAAAVAAAAAAASGPTETDEDSQKLPPDGSAGGGGNEDGNGDGFPKPSEVVSPNAKRPFLPGVPYLRVPLGLELVTGIPAFTNFTPEFTETLDYVFIEGGRSEGGGVAASGSGAPERATADAALEVEGGGGGGGCTNARGNVVEGHDPGFTVGYVPVGSRLSCG